MGFTTTPLAPLARAPVILSAVITDALKKFSRLNLLNSSMSVKIGWYASPFFCFNNGTPAPS